MNRMEKRIKNISSKDLFIRLAQRREIGLLILLFSTILIVSIVNPAFLSLGNIRDILVKNAPVAIVGCGLTLVILTGEIDISVGSLMGLIATIVGLLTSAKHLGLPVWVGILAALLTGLGIGFINGLLVTIGRIPSIIVTLGMLTALRGINELLMGGKWITDLPPGLRFWGIGYVAGIPVSLWTTLIVIVFSVILARRTPLGRRIYAVGSNPEAARLAGLSNRKIKIFVFALTGLLTGIATIISVTRLSVIESGIGVGFELMVVTCVVVGGTSISGGRGNISGTLLGVLLLGMVGTVLIFLRLGEMSTYWERAIQGSFILLAVLVDHLANIHSRTEAAG